VFPKVQDFNLNWYISPGPLILPARIARLSIKTYHRSAYLVMFLRSDQLGASAPRAQRFHHKRPLPWRSSRYSPGCFLWLRASGALASLLRGGLGQAASAPGAALAGRTKRQLFTFLAALDFVGASVAPINPWRDLRPRPNMFFCHGHLLSVI
jgi:hypothetical protein